MRECLKLVSAYQLILDALENKSVEEAVSGFTGPLSRNLGELAKNCAAFYRDNKSKMLGARVRTNRISLAKAAEKFHRDCDTFSSSAEESCGELADKECVVLMTGHQPNLFAYSGVFRKASLNYVLAEKLKEDLGVPVVNFFVVLDQDFAGDRWIRSAQLPSLVRRGGALDLRASFSDGDRETMVNEVAKPSVGQLEEWKRELEVWLSESLKVIAKFVGGERIEAYEAEVAGNLQEFWVLVEEACGLSANFADFNAFVMSKIVNGVWNYDTLFLRTSDFEPSIEEEFCWLLAHFDGFSKFVKEGEELLTQRGVSLNVAGDGSDKAPFWYHCDCGGKVDLRLNTGTHELEGRGSCSRCDKAYALSFGDPEKPSLSEVKSRFSSRAISILLAYYRGLGVSCDIRGVGGLDYLMEARYVANKLGVSFPPSPVWRPRDKYLGVAQFEALLQFKEVSGSFDVGLADNFLAHLREEALLLSKRLKDSRRKGAESKANFVNRKLRDERRGIAERWRELNRNARLLERVPTTLEVMPSIIDYAVDVGLEETSDQWVAFLKGGGSLFSDVELQSVFSDFGLMEWL